MTDAMIQELFNHGVILFGFVFSIVVLNLIGITIRRLIK